MDRPSLIDALRTAVTPHPWIEAAFLAGSEATGRTDDQSDIDLILVVPRAHQDAAFETAEACLEQLGGGIGPRVTVLHGPDRPFRQRFYRLRRVPECLMVDLVIVDPDRLAPLLDPARHGAPVVWFDRQDVLQPTPDPEVAPRRRARRRHIAEMVEMFAHLPAKELARGDAIAAFGFHHRFLIGPLVELLRIEHCPERFDFGLRYLDRDLPPEAVAALQPLILVGDAAALQGAVDGARRWIRDLLEGEVADEGG